MNETNPIGELIVLLLCGILAGWFLWIMLIKLVRLFIWQFNRAVIIRLTVGQGVVSQMIGVYNLKVWDRHLTLVRPQYSDKQISDGWFVRPIKRLNMKDYDNRRQLSTWFKCPKCNEDVRAFKKAKLCVSCQQKKDYRTRHPKEENEKK